MDDECLKDSILQAIKEFREMTSESYGEEPITPEMQANAVVKSFWIDDYEDGDISHEQLRENIRDMRQNMIDMNESYKSFREEGGYCSLSDKDLQEQVRQTYLGFIAQDLEEGLMDDDTYNKIKQRILEHEFN